MQDDIFRKLDRDFQAGILDWIPEKILDFHTHVGLDDYVEELTPARRKESFVSQASSLPYEDLKKDMNLLLPKKKIEYVCFPFPYTEVCIEKANEYVLQADYPFILGDIFNQKDSLKLLNEKTVRGLKVYYDFVKKDYSKINIKDFLPEVFLQELNLLKKTLMLHVPRESLNDEENIKEIYRICKKYKDLKVVLAHMGRCHNAKDFVKGIKDLKNFDNLFVDTSVVSSKEVFFEALNILGFKKILYGSDYPFSAPRGDIFNVKGVMKNAFITEEVFDWTIPELREWYLKGSFDFTFFLYYQIMAMKIACEKVNLKKENIEDIFYNNGVGLLN